MSRRRRTTPAADVLMRLRREAPPINAYPPPVDPYPNAWPYATPMHVPTAYLPVYERTER
jgi:hypothetical protein